MSLNKCMFIGNVGRDPEIRSFANGSTMTPLPRLAEKLRALTGQSGPVPGYRKLYLLALDGALPTERRNGRLFVQDVDLPAIAKLLGLTVPTAMKTREYTDHEPTPRLDGFLV